MDRLLPWLWPCGVYISFLMFTRQTHSVEKMTAVWLLPVVVAEFTAASAGLLVSHLGDHATDFAFEYAERREQGGGAVALVVVCVGKPGWVRSNAWIWLFLGLGAVVDCSDVAADGLFEIIDGAFRVSTIAGGPLPRLPVSPRGKSKPCRFGVICLTRQQVPSMLSIATLSGSSKRSVTICV